MNDIEILERLIEDYEMCREVVCIRDIEAIKNLINRVKELEEENKRIKSIDYYKVVEDIETGQYIPKSKIKEKIEEYTKLVKDFEEYWSKDPRKFKKEKSTDYYKIEALKELLEEE